MERPIEGGAIAGNANFNPRSREWSDRHHRKGRPNRTISIHAPASGATVIRTRHGDVVSISIHAPASGATGTIGGSGSGGSDFNPRSREWSDLKHLPRCSFQTDFNPRSREWSDSRGWCACNLDIISIHAPASGATAFIDIFSFTVRLYFISSH